MLKKELLHINGDTKRYFDLVKEGLLYDDIIAKSKLTKREDAKELIYNYCCSYFNYPFINE